MKSEEEYFILGFLSFLILLIIGLSFFGRRKSSLYKFIFTKRLERISWKKVGKMFLIIQGFFLFCKIGNENMSWFLTISFPIILIMIVLTYYFTNMEIVDKDKDLQYTDEYKSYKKVIDRDNKISDILK